MSYWEELKRRNVVRVAAAYLAFAWLIAQIASLVFPAFDFANVAMRALIIAFALGFPVALVCAWIYELTPDGIRRTENLTASEARKIGFGRRLDFAIIGALSLALIGVVTDQYILNNGARYQAIAVLPFKSLSADPDQEYFADGMTDTLIATLGRVKSLAVISRTSVMRFKGSEQTLQSIAAALGADVVVEATTQRAGGRILVSASLVDGAADRQIWSGTFEENYENVLRLQSNMAQEIVDGIRAVLTPDDAARLAAGQPVNPAAYDAYLRGFSHLYRLSPQDYDLAEGYFEQARDIDPDSVLGWVGLATVWGFRAQTNAVASAEAAPAVREYAERAARIDEENAAVQRALGSAAYLERDYVEAETRVRRAIQLEPGGINGLNFLATLRMIFGDYDEAVVLTARTMELDPLNPYHRMLYAVALMGARRYDASIVAFRETVEVAPFLGTAWLNFASCLHHAGYFDEAIDPTHEWLKVTRNSEALSAFDAGLADGGYEQGMGRLADVLARQSLETGLQPMTVARHYSYAGNAEQVIEWVERAYELGDPNAAMIRMPGFDLIREDPRLQVLMDKMGI